MDDQAFEAGAIAVRPAITTRSRAARPTWIVPAALILLSLVPVLLGSLRLVSLSGAADIMPANARFSAQPLPLILHIVSATVYAVVGAFQFSPGIRRRSPGWHRAAGRTLVLAGLIVALSALWLNQFYSRPAGSGELLYLFRLLFGTGMLLSIVLGYRAIRRHDIARHRAWMIRAYAIGIAAGTQVFTQGFGGAIFGTSELSLALLTVAGWVINLSVAELAIRRRTGRPAATAPARIPVAP
jgi:uncharacterized membrane protein